MDRFLSNAVNSIDAKGRVSVPAHFRAVLQKRGYQDLYALRALDVPALGSASLVGVESLRAREPNKSRRLTSFTRHAAAISDRIASISVISAVLVSSNAPHPNSSRLPRRR